MASSCEKVMIIPPHTSEEFLGW